MAKKSMIIKSKRTPKFKVRAYTRCERCGRPHGVMRKLQIFLQEFVMQNK